MSGIDSSSGVDHNIPGNRKSNFLKSESVKKFASRKTTQKDQKTRPEPGLGKPISGLDTPLPPDTKVEKRLIRPYPYNEESGYISDKEYCPELPCKDEIPTLDTMSIQSDESGYESLDDNCSQASFEDEGSSLDTIGIESNDDLPKDEPLSPVPKTSTNRSFSEAELFESKKLKSRSMPIHSEPTVKEVPTKETGQNIQELSSEHFINDTARNLLNKTTPYIPKSEFDFFNVILRPAIITCQAESKAIDYGIASDYLYDFAQKLESKSPPSNPNTNSIENTQANQFNSMVAAYKNMAFLMQHKFRSMVFSESKKLLLERLKKFEQPGTRQVKEKGFSLSAALGLGSVKEKVNISEVLAGSDDTKIRAYKGREITIGLSGGKGISAHFSIGGQLGKGKTFKNIDDCVDYCADKMVKSLPSIEYRHLMSGNHQSEILASMEKQLISHPGDIIKPLEELGIVDTKDTDLTYVRTRIPAPNELERTKLSAKAGASIAGTVSGEAGADWTSDQFTKRVPLIEQLKSNPKLLSDYPDKYFSIKLTESEIKLLSILNYQDSPPEKDKNRGRLALKAISDQM